MVPLRRGTSRFLLLITCYPQEPHTGPPSPSHSTEVSVVYIGLDPSLDNYLLVEPYIPAPPPSTRAVIHLSTRVMVPLRHGTSRFLLLITRYKPSLRLVPSSLCEYYSRFSSYTYSRERRHIQLHQACRDIRFVNPRWSTYSPLEATPHRHRGWFRAVTSRSEYYLRIPCILILETVDTSSSTKSTETSSSSIRT